MVEFNDPFIISVTPELCDDGTCAPCSGSVPTGCLVCGYPSGEYQTCLSNSASIPCVSGAVDCLNCEAAFAGIDIQFLGGYVSGFNGKIGFGASESYVNIDIVLPKTKCLDATANIPLGVCCLPDGSCSTLYADQTDCENAGGVWHSNSTCDDDPCSCECTGNDPTYEGKLGYIYTFNMGSFCFRGILSNHNYSEDSSGYRYRVTLTDGRNILGNIPVLLYRTHIALPSGFISNALSVGQLGEPSVAENTCGNGNQCEDFMTIGIHDNTGIKVKKALETINGECISIPVSNAGLNLKLDRLIAVMSEEIRTQNTEATVLELITTASDESGYDFMIEINNNNEFEVIPINYKRPATDKSLFTFIENLSATDSIISKDYGEEMATGSQKNKRIVIGDNMSYLTTVVDHPYQRDCAYTLPSIYPIPMPNGIQQPCYIINNPASIGAYNSFHIVPSGYPPC